MICEREPILPTAVLVTNVFRCMMETPHSCISCVSIAMVSWRSIIHCSHLREQIEFQVVWQDALTIVQMDTYIAMLELREWRRVQKRAHMLKLIMMITYYDTVGIQTPFTYSFSCLYLSGANKRTHRHANEWKKISFNVNQFKQKPFTEINIFLRRISLRMIPIGCHRHVPLSNLLQKIYSPRFESTMTWNLMDLMLIHTLE